MLHSNSSLERTLSSEPDLASNVPDTLQHSTDASETPKVPVLGKTLLFRGELTAEEDVILQGRVEGSIRHARNLVIGTEGSVLGDVFANHLTVEGLVEGDLHCNEAVIVHAKAQVRGNIFAPRVGIMEGAFFNGRIEMDPAAERASNPQAQARPGSKQTVPARSPGATGTSSRTGVDTSPGRSTPSGSGAATSHVAGAPGASTPSSPLANAAIDQMLGTQGVQKK